MEEKNSTTGHGLSRRTVLKAGAVGAAASPFLVHSAQAEEARPFQHGVAAGDPWPESIILWTRVTTTPEDVPGSERGVLTNLTYEMSLTPGFEQIIASGPAQALPDRDSTVHVEATGLQPYTQYYYRFRINDGIYAGHYSPVGKAKTAPAPGHTPERFRAAFLSCSNWESGYFHAYRDLAQRGDIELAIHVGDYIYEYSTGEYVGKQGVIRPHEPAHTLASLQDYRIRYGKYHTDPDLQAAHAACAWVLTWDDHEVSNDAWADGSEFIEDPEEMHLRRNTALIAYLEWLPVRAINFSFGGHIYRNLRFGDLFELDLLDLRSYRSQPAKWNDSYDPNRTIMGKEQFEWIQNQLSLSTTKWNIIGNPVMITPILLPAIDRKWTQGLHDLIGFPLDGITYNSDQWDGFPVERQKFLEFIRDKNMNNVVFITGDIHTSWASDVAIIPGQYVPGTTNAVEFVGPSISSPNIDDMYGLPDGTPIPGAIAQAALFANPYTKYCDLENHGYCVLEIAPEYIHCDWIYTHKKENPDSTMYIAKSFRTEQGRGVFPADKSL
ncbi:MAG: alkaline phosphatase D family protein [Corynebacterium sp.]|nr:alkaline phosphatase D family protein [Corynebacterium sp.]